MNMELNKIYHGFRLLESKQIKEIGATAYRFFHEKSGARLLYLDKADDNKVFSIAFRTPPTDDTGVAHIVEHSVLCGSRKFPLKEPFVELVKGSLNTFLNAMTYPDKTVYPVASRNDKDFHNLMDVYLDAVFYPVMQHTPEILMQEGWHYEIEKPEDPLTYSGVVYNEMKGALSSPDDLLESKIISSLFPDTTYGYESGGDPAAIPSLTQEMFTDFHKKYYHPSNSYIYLYGEMDLEEKLAFLDTEYLQNFDRMEVPSDIAVQPLFSAPKILQDSYPVGGNEPTEERTFLSLNSIVGRVDEAEKLLALEILEHALLKTQAAPLKKALVDAKLGKDVMSSFEDGILQPYFSIIINGAEAERRDEFVCVVRECMKDLVTNGIDRLLLEASINLLEFKLREDDFGQYPKGLIYYLKIMNSWLYDGDPTEPLYYEELLQTMKDGLKTGYFEKVLQECFLENPHQTVLVLSPDVSLARKREEDLRQQLAQKKESLSKEELCQIIDWTAQLKERQAAEDSPEALASIPLLEIGDIRTKAEELPCKEKAADGIKVLHHDLPTNEIAYINAYFDATAVPEEDLFYAFLLTELLGKVSTKKYSYATLANQINLHTGGISCDLVAYSRDGEPDLVLPKFKVKAKALVKKLPQLQDLLQEILLNSCFDDEKRVRELLDQCRASMEMQLLRAAHQVTAARLSSYFSPAGRYNEKGGLSFYHFLKDLTENFSERYPQLQQKMVQLLPAAFSRKNLLISLTAEEKYYDAFTAAMLPLCQAFSEGKENALLPEFQTDKKNEGLMTSSQVQYVSKGANFIKLGYAFHGSMRVLETILRYDYFWTKIRVQGGAYGAFTSFKRNGDMMFGSYRDPNLMETIRVFDATAEYLHGFTVSDREMVKYIIGTMSGVDAPLTSKMRGEAAAECYIRSVTLEDRQKLRDEILTTRQKDIAALAELVGVCMKENYLCVLGDEEKIKENQGLFGNVAAVFS